MINLFRYLLIGLAAPALLSGCATHKIQPQKIQAKVHQKRLPGGPDIGELAAINRQWNRLIRYKPDSREDHWQSPAETLQLGTGDCEDISIAKMLDPAIHNTIPADQLRLSYVHTPTGVPHMVLIIGEGPDSLVLDNLSDEIKQLSESGYRPVYQLDAAGQVYQNNQPLQSHPKFEKFEMIISQLNPGRDHQIPGRGSRQLADSSTPSEQTGY